jgi:hypothetical protein
MSQGYSLTFSNILQEDHFVPLYVVVGASAPTVPVSVPELGEAGSQAVAVKSDGSTSPADGEASWPPARLIHDAPMGGQSLAAYRFD